MQRSHQTSSAPTSRGGKNTFQASHLRLAFTFQVISAPLHFLHKVFEDPSCRFFSARHLTEFLPPGACGCCFLRSELPGVRDLSRCAPWRWLVWRLSSLCSCSSSCRMHWREKQRPQILCGTLLEELGSRLYCSQGEEAFHHRRVEVTSVGVQRTTVTPLSCLQKSDFLIQRHFHLGRLSSQTFFAAE